MDLKKVLTISGYPELYKFITHAKNGILVEAITTKRRMIAFSHYRISTLEDIAVYTTDGEIPLKEVFKRIFKHQQGKPVEIKMSDRDGIIRFIETVLPEYDRDRVKFSDMKKIIKWYNLLLEHGYIDDKDDEDDKTEKQPEEDTDKNEEKNDNNDDKNS